MRFSKTKVIAFQLKIATRNNRLLALHGFRLLLDGGQNRVLGSNDVTHQPPDVTVARQRELGWVPDVVGQPPPSVVRLCKLVIAPFLRTTPSTTCEKKKYLLYLHI